MNKRDCDSRKHAEPFCKNLKALNNDILQSFTRGFSKIFLFLATFFFFLIFPCHSILSSDTCIKCHDSLVPSSTWTHVEIGCTGCHTFQKGFEHPEDSEPVQCQTCHEDVETEFNTSVHSEKINGKHNADCQSCHGYHPVFPSDHLNSPTSPANIVKTCAKCHEDEKLIRERGIPVKAPLKAYLLSVHGQSVVDQKNKQAATCKDCHGSHGIKQGLHPDSKINRGNIPGTCGTCHNTILTIYLEGKHGQAFAKGAQDAPVCTTCHGEHQILPHESPESLVYKGKISQETCRPCHASERILRKYGMASDRFVTYEDSYHGLADTYGDTTVANCASCHGYHDVLPSSDPRSPVSKENLSKTCGKCHPGASEKFTQGKVHAGVYSRGEIGEVTKYYIRLVYLVLIPLVIAGMFFHNLLDFIKRLKIAIIKRATEIGFERVPLAGRIQHILVFASFFILVITGFALRFNWGIMGMSGEFNSILRSLSHRIAGIVFIVASLWHLVYLASADGRKFIWEMIPTFQDLHDIIATLLYYFNLGGKPKYGRFSYIEKSEYLALVWGAVIMIVTGLILWFEEEAMRFMPKWGVDVAGMIHYYEAILATLAIIVWHFYHVHIKGGVEKMNLSWITGNLTEEEMEDEHEKELEAREEQN